MNHKGMLYLLLAVLLGGLVSLWGCPKKAEVTSSPEAQKENVTAPATPPAETTEAKPGMKSEVPGEMSGAAMEGLKPVYFDFDKSFIRDDARTVLKTNADWLKTHPKAKIKIEGNCDERGTIEYNQALGQRRAVNARKYLAELGISGKRISLISFGKEKPVCTGHDETCWQKNRRGDFVVVTE